MRRCVGSEFHTQTGAVTITANKKKEMLFTKKRRQIFHFGGKYFERFCKSPSNQMCTWKSDVKSGVLGQFSIG